MGFEMEIEMGMGIGRTAGPKARSWAKPGTLGTGEAQNIGSGTTGAEIRAQIEHNWHASGSGAAEHGMEYLYGRGRRLGQKAAITQPPPQRPTLTWPRGSRRC